MPHRFFKRSSEQKPAVSAWRRGSSVPPAILRLVLVLAVSTLLIATDLRAADTATVIGTITYHNGKPAVNVFVSIGGRYRYTDVSGRFKLDGVPEGLQLLMIKRGQSTLLQEKVTITNESPNVVNRVLPI
jgi:hypothetical protein